MHRSAATYKRTSVSPENASTDDLCRASRRYVCPVKVLGRTKRERQHNNCLCRHEQPSMRIPKLSLTPPRNGSRPGLSIPGFEAKRPYSIKYSTRCKPTLRRIWSGRDIHKLEWRRNKKKADITHLFPPSLFRRLLHSLLRTLTLFFSCSCGTSRSSYFMKR